VIKRILFLKNNMIKEYLNAENLFIIMRKKRERKEVLRSIFNTFILVFFICFFCLGVYAIPQTFSVHGRLTNTTNDALSGDYNMTFKIYDAVSGGNLLWFSDTWEVSTDSNGVYNVILNDINLSFSDAYYLGVTVGTDSEMSPRINLTSTPYTFRANSTDYLEDTKNYKMQNLTLGEKITFAFGEIIDNLVNGIVQITGNLRVTGEGNFSGEVYVNNETAVSPWLYNQSLATSNMWNNSWSTTYNVTYAGSINNDSYLSTYNSSYLINLTNINILDLNASSATIHGDANITGSLFVGNTTFNGGWGDNGVSITGGSVFAQSLYVYNITSLAVTHLNINGSLFPFFDDEFDIGNVSNRFRNLYLSGDANISGDLFIFGQNASNIYVPYSGATGNVNLTGYNLTTGGIVATGWESQFGTATQYWKIEDLDLGVSGVYPMLAPYSDGGVGNYGAIANSFFLYDKADIGNMNIVFTSNDISGAESHGVIKYTTETEKFSFDGFIGSTFSGVTIGGNLTVGGLFGLHVDDDNKEVGIGTVNPVEKLNVVGNTNITQDLWVGRDVTIKDDFVLTDDADIGGDLDVTGNTKLTGTLFLTRNITAEYYCDVSGCYNISINQSLATSNMWNNSWSTTYNETYHNFAYNHTLIAQAYTDANMTISVLQGILNGTGLYSTYNNLQCELCRLC